VSLISSITANITRSAGDPKVLQTGPGSLNEADRLGRALGWFSIGLGVVELLAPRRLARTLGWLTVGLMAAAAVAMVVLTFGGG
jgi:hypothetical protein